MARTSVQTRRWIGNDVVDLNDPAIAAVPVRARFVQRVCNEHEVARVGAAADPASLLWSLFAAKEAAYKAAVKHIPGLVFAHRLFAVADDMTSVCHPQLTLRLWLSSGPGWVHAIAVANADAAMVCPAHWLEPTRAGEALSPGVRRLVRTSLAQRLGCDVGELGVVRDEKPGSWTGYGPPRLVRDGRDTGIDITLSHDGRFVAAASLAPSA